MFLFKGVQAIERGGIFFFTRRKTTSMKYVAEFAIVPSFPLSSQFLSFALHNIYVKKDKCSSLKIQPFHVELNDRDGTCRVLFETKENTRYRLCCKEVVYCSFVVCDFEKEKLKTKSKIGAKLDEMKVLLLKLFDLVERYPELLLHSHDLDKYGGISLLLYFHELFESVRSKKNDCALYLTQFNIKECLQKIPSIDECLENIMKVDKKTGQKYDKQVREICDRYLEKLKETPRCNFLKLFRLRNCSGFLAMCRISANGNEFATELCNRFLQCAIGRTDSLIISSIAMTSFSTINDLSVIITDFLAQYSIIGQNTYLIDEKEELFDCVNKLKSSTIGLFRDGHLYSNVNFNKPNYNTDFLYSIYLKCNIVKKVNSVIPPEVFYNASISGRNGSATCCLFFKHIYNNFKDETVEAVGWAADFNLGLKESYDLYLRLHENNDDFATVWIARKHIIGIPGFLERNQSYGYEILRKRAIGGDLTAASSIGYLFLKQVEGIPQDLEMSLFWYRKSVTMFLNEEKVWYLDNLGIKIQHSDDYFLNYTLQ